MSVITQTQVYFLGGPNDKHASVIQHEVGLTPAKIRVEGVEAWPGAERSDLRVRQGTYEESPFGGNVYLWRGWDEDDAAVES